MTTLTNNELTGKNLEYFTNVIYNNFIDIAETTHLNHTKHDIFQTLNSSSVNVCCLTINKKIVAYLVSTTMVLSDGRYALYIYYLFTSKKHRNNGYASKLLEKSEDIAKHNNISYIVLTCDISNKKLFEFYKSRNYQIDSLLKNNTKHEVLSKLVSD